MSKRVEVGIVTGDKMLKTRRVEIPRLVKHPKYGKFLRRKTVCHVHDENEESKLGDTVEIVECPPKSRLKRWALVRVVSKSRAVDLAARKAAEALAAAEAQAASEAAAAAEALAGSESIGKSAGS